MKIKHIVAEDFVNYKKPSMFIATAECDWKCSKGLNYNVCQNSDLAKMPTMEVSNDRIVEFYMNNPLTSAIVFGGLEPFEQFDELLTLVNKFRTVTKDDIVIYTGYYRFEVERYIEQLKYFTNIIVKFGRYYPQFSSRFDEVLEVELASKNQYAEVIS